MYINTFADKKREASTVLLATDLVNTQILFRDNISTMIKSKSNHMLHHRFFTGRKWLENLRVDMNKVILVGI